MPSVERGICWHRPQGEPLANAIAYEVAMGFARATDAEFMAPLAETFFADVREVFDAGDVYLGLRIVQYAYPAFLVGRGVDVVAMGERWLAENTDAHAVLVKLMTDGLDHAQQGGARATIGAVILVTRSVRCASFVVNNAHMRTEGRLRRARTRRVAMTAALAAGLALVAPAALADDYDNGGFESFAYGDPVGQAGWTANSVGGVRRRELRHRRG